MVRFDVVSGREKLYTHRKAGYPFEVYNLQFFAKDGPGGEKTEQPTAKKLGDARKDGQTAKSKELVTALTLLALFLLCRFYLATLGNGLLSNFSEFYRMFEKIPEESPYGMPMKMATQVVGMVFRDILKLVFPIFIIALVIGILGNALQQKWKITAKPIHPKLSKISIISGFKRIFSPKKLFELLKSIAMMCIIAYVAYTTIKGEMSLLYKLYEVTLMDAVAATGNIVIDVGTKISAIFLIVGFVDLIYQKRKFRKDMMMTKQEVKDEFKNAEGDPQIKGQIRRRMQEASRRRMMQALPEADVVITNPTHFAVALKYEPNEGKAPVVIAKGADYLAKQIKEKAREYQIEIVENKPLARILYNNVEIGAEIPQELYQAVAEVLAFVYALKNK